MDGAKYQYLFKEKFGKEINKINLIHGLIWLSLTGYVKEDYDSILTSFYKGLFIINELEKIFLILELILAKGFKFFLFFQIVLRYLI